MDYCRCGHVSVDHYEYIGVCLIGVCRCQTYDLAPAGGPTSAQLRPAGATKPTNEGEPDE